MKNVLYPLAVFLLLVFGTGCGSFLSSLRQDLNDDQAPSADSQPTVGGRWAEKDFLGNGDDRYMAVGHSERSPASSDASGTPDDGSSWVSADRRSANARDMSRGQDDGSEQSAVSFSNTPNLPPPTKRLYKNGNRATRDDFVDDSQNEGSLWASDGQSNYFFSKNKVRGVGDILTVTLEPDMIRDIGVEVKRTLNENEKDIEMQLAQDRANARVAGLVGGDKNKDAVSTSQAAPAAAPSAPTLAANGGNVPNAEVLPSDIDVSKSLDVKAGDTMMAEIVERYPNGNYKIRGTKKLIYKNGAPRLINFVGVVRGTDIGEDETVASGKLYEYQIEAAR